MRGRRGWESKGKIAAALMSFRPGLELGKTLKKKIQSPHLGKQAQVAGCQAGHCSWGRGQLPLPQPKGEQGHGTQSSEITAFHSSLPSTAPHTPPGSPPQPQNTHSDPAQPQKEYGVKQRAHPCSSGTEGVFVPCLPLGEAQTAPRHGAPPGLQHL